MDNPLPQVSATAYALGIVSGAALALALGCPLFASFVYLPLYVCSVATFHFLEYFCTASYQPARVDVSSFVLNDTALYHVAHATALSECLVELWLVPGFKKNPGLRPVKLVGLLLTVAGQCTRSLAMKTAGQNFSHVIQRKKEQGHVLVTHGIYAYLRHPSYVGFFYWALGTQLLLLNPLSLCLCAVLLYRCFSSRIRYEEGCLTHFFGKDYVAYKRTSRIGIPFI